MRAFMKKINIHLNVLVIIIGMLIGAMRNKVTLLANMTEPFIFINPRILASLFVAYSMFYRVFSMDFYFF